MIKTKINEILVDENRNSWLAAAREFKIIVVLGAGGVGKTTIASSLAIELAKTGLNVGLLSIDPSKRLAQALGLDLSGEMKEVDLKAFGGGSGRLTAAIMQEKAIFDDLVIRSSKNRKIADKILNHSLYRFASSKFGGIGEYMALAKVGQLSFDTKIDLIVLDTPPDAHALDFLDRPQKIQRLLEGKIIKLILIPLTIGSKFGLGRLTSLGSRLLGGLSKVTGITALTILAEFIVMMKDVISDLADTSKKLSARLESMHSGFVIVTTSRPSARRVGIALLEQLRMRSLNLSAVLVNRFKNENKQVSLSFNSSELLEESWKLFSKSLENNIKSDETTFADLTKIVEENQKSNKHFVIRIYENDPFLYTSF